MLEPAFNILFKEFILFLKLVLKLVLPVAQTVHRWTANVSGL